MYLDRRLIIICICVLTDLSRLSRNNDYKSVNTGDHISGDCCDHDNGWYVQLCLY